MRNRLLSLAGRLSVSILILTPLASAAQDETIVLVSNFSESASGNHAFLRDDIAQRFQVAPSGRYALASVKVSLKRQFTGGAELEDITMTLAADDDNSPGATLATFSTPGSPEISSSSRDYTFTLSTAVALEPNTRYFIRLNSNETNIRKQVQISRTSSDNEDSNGLSDWTIDNAAREQSGSNWNDESGSIRMELKGAVVPGMTVPMTGVTASPTALTVIEGSNATYTVVLDTRPSEDVTISLSYASGSDEDITVDKTSLVFTTENWNAAQEITVSAAEDDDDINGSATIEHSASGGDYGGVTVPSVTATEADNDAAAGVIVTPTALTVVEGGSAKYGVALTSPPSADVTISLSFASGSDEDITVDKTSLVFTPENWSAAQEVTVSAAEDDDATDGSATIEHTASGGDYGGVTIGSVTATESDNDAAPGVTIHTGLTVTEGGSAKYEVALTSQPSADVTILLSYAPGSDEDITVDKPSLAFTPENWNEAQEVTVSAAEDDDAIDGSATIEHKASGEGQGDVSAFSVTATERDNDTAGVTIHPTAFMAVEGSNAKYSVVLDTRPSADVTLSLSFASGSDEDITVDKTSLAFTPENWNTAQEVTVSAAEDDDALNGAATIEHAASGGDYGGVTVPSVTATEEDNDTPGVTVMPTALTVLEGDSAKYAVALTTQPSGDVTISVFLAAGSDEDITADKPLLIFTPENWNATQEVTASAAEDYDATNGVATIEHAASGGGYGGVSVPSVTATESDNDAVAGGVTVTPTALTVTEGGGAKYGVALMSQPSGDVTISASFASGSDEDIAVDKTSLAFTPENWNAAQEITVSAAEDDDALNGTATIEHAASGGGYDNATISSVTAAEEDNDAAGVTMTPAALTVPEGGGATYMVALDTRPSADVTISLSFAAGSDADITIDKTSLAFTQQNWSAAQGITVSTVEDDDAIDGSATIEHTASGGDYGDLPVSSVTATESDNDTRGVTVSPPTLAITEGSIATYTVALDTQPSDDVTITASFAPDSDEDVTASPTSLAFTPENWSVAQEVTVSAAVDHDIYDDGAALNHRASGGDYNEVAVSDVAVRVTDETGRVDVSAWLARYSRVSADHLLSSVEHRMERAGRDTSGMQASVAGRRIAFGDGLARRNGVFFPFSGASALRSASQEYMTASVSMGGGAGYGRSSYDGGGGYGSGGRHSARPGNSYGISPGLNAAVSRYRNLTLREALSRSAFRYAGQTASGNSFGIWGQGAFSRFGGGEAGADITGNVISGTIGIDHNASRWLRGFAVSRSESEGIYRIAGEEDFSLSATVTGVYPYARYDITDRLQVWGAGGLGGGSLRLERDSLAALSSTSDLSMALGSAGMRGDIVSAGSQGFGLSWQTDAMLVRSSLDASRSLTAATTVAHRLRLSLKGSYILRLGSQASLAPKVRLGARRDGGDAERGMGMDVAGGLGFMHSGWGLRAQVDMHGLVAHEDSDFEEWGVSGMILFDRSPSSILGPSLCFTPYWGSPPSSGGLRALWSRETMSGLARLGHTGLAGDRSLRLESRFDYGIAAGDHGVASPYASVSFSGGEAARSVLAGAGIGADTGAGVEIGGGLGYSNASRGLFMRAGMRGLTSEAGLEAWGASGVVSFDPDPSSPLGASFNVSPSWGVAPRTGFGGMQQSMGTMRGREPYSYPRSATGLSRHYPYGRPLRVEGGMGYGFSASGGKGVATPYAGIAYSDGGGSGVLVGFNLQAGRRFLLNVEGGAPEAGARNRAISFDSVSRFRVRGLLKW